MSKSSFVTAFIAITISTFLVLQNIYALPSQSSSSKKFVKRGPVKDGCFTGDSKSDCLWISTGLKGQAYKVNPGSGITITDCESQGSNFEGEYCKVTRSVPSATIDVTCIPTRTSGLKDVIFTIIWDENGPSLKNPSINEQWTPRKTNNQLYYLAELVCDVTSNP